MYFYEVAAHAQKHNLQYMADASLPSMFLGNTPEGFREKMKDVPDTVRLEQYMDFLTNRRFRSTILCRADVELKRNIDSREIRNYAVCFVKPVKPITDVDSERPVEVRTVDGKFDLMTMDEMVTGVFAHIFSRRNLSAAAALSKSYQLCT